MKKIKLLIDIPVDKKHEMFKGRILDVIEYQPHIYKKRGSKAYWVEGYQGEKVKIWPYECEELSNQLIEKIDKEG